MTILVEVFGRLQEHGIMVNTAKYIFFQSGLEFPGHWSFKRHIRPFPQQMDAIIESESYQCHRLEVVSRTNLAITLHPLHDLFQKKRPWKWAEECEDAFVNDMKQLQISFACPLLKRPLWLVCDSSPNGVG